MLTLKLAEQLACIALGHVTQEYPFKPDHVLNGPDDLVPPRTLHPMFYGSFDWHSCVHSHWLLARVLRRYPNLPIAERIRRHFSTVFTPDHVAVELAYLARPLSGAFERPYGWAWLLMLAAELPKGAADTLQPLAAAFAQRFRDFLPKAAHPVRHGVHSNTAFALALAMDYARTRQDEPLAQVATSAARRWYLDDANYPGWEPSGEDFLSPGLIEAECMRRVLPADEFAAWFSGFLPHLERREPRALFQPAAASDRTDGRLVHLDGLNLSRAWCWSNLATSLPDTDPRAGLMRDAAAQHRAASLGHIGDHYMGGHWLATFALLALEAADVDSGPATSHAVHHPEGGSP